MNPYLERSFKMDEITKMVDEQIKTEIKGLSSLEPGSDAKSKAVSDLSKLYQMRLDEAKNEAAEKEQKDRHELERDKHFLECLVRDDEKDLKIAQHKSQKCIEWLKIGVDVALTVASFVAYDAWSKRGFRFEETGTICSPQNRNLLSKMLPKLRK